MDMLDVASTGMYTILTLVMNFKWNACKNWTSSLKFVVILAQCRYSEIARRVLKYSDLQYTSLTLDKKNWTVWCIERYSMSTHMGLTNFQKQSGFLAHPVHCESKTCDPTFIDNFDKCRRFHKFFHFWTQQEICSITGTTFLNAP